MSGLQTLLNRFATTTHDISNDGETVFQHPLTHTRIALAADGEAIHALAVYGWTPAIEQETPRFNALAALQRVHPSLNSLHPDELATVITPESVRPLIEAQPIEQRGRLARWLLGRSRATGNADLAKSTRDACSELPVQADHPLAPAAGQATHLQGPGSVARITGTELAGYKLLQVDTATGRTMLTSAATLDDLWTPNPEWTTAQWRAYEQLLSTAPCDGATFAAHVDTDRADAASHTQHLWAIQFGTASYLGAATDDLRRRYRHAPSSQWLDSASTETGINLRSAGGVNRLIDLYMVEHVSDAEVLQHIVPAMREADSDFAELPERTLLSIWRSAYNPILNSAMRDTVEAVKLRIGHSPAAQKSTAESMRGLLANYYGAGPIATLELSGKLQLVDTTNDLPPMLRDEIAMIGAEDRVSGLTYDSTVYLVGANTEPKDVCSVFLHEVGEHASLRTMLGRDYGRVVQRFNELLAEGDTYAVQASMLVPNTTAPSNLNSEHLAHLIQLAAPDAEPREGGQGGFELGQRCIRDLRTWLFRTPLMRELERQGELEDFKLDAHDIATLAREAVDFHVAGANESTTAHNQWDAKLDDEFVSDLYGMSVDARTISLLRMPADAQMAYLYALGTMGAPGGAETIERMSDAVAGASNSEDLATRVLAEEISALGIRLSTQSKAASGLDDHGFFAAISGAHDPATAVLTLVRADDRGWAAEHYTMGMGITLRERFDTVADVAQTFGQHHFPVQAQELDGVISRWGAEIAAEHRKLDSQAFQRWFHGSTAVHGDGSPMVLYHGTVKDYSVANRMFWASAATPAELRAAPAGSQSPEARHWPSDFNDWFKGSVITDQHGQPLRVYHGTSEDFDEFREGPSYFTPRTDYSYIRNSDIVKPVYLSIQNPYRPSNQQEIEQIRSNPDRYEELKAQGFDGMLWSRPGDLMKGASGWGNDLPQIVTFYPGQVKSAITNPGAVASAGPVVAQQLKGSILADDYAQLRQDYVSPGQGDRALIMPVYLSARAPFDADRLPQGSSKVIDLRDELVRQAEQAGREVDLQLVASLVKTITKSAKAEESGPYYNSHNFWFDSASLFGGAGAAALGQLYAHCGFDSIKVTESGHMTVGVFEPSQVKSAIGNTGLYSANPDMRFAFAGVNAQTHDSDRLDRAKALAEGGVSPESIWEQTGWMNGPEGEWRFEVDDSKARVRGYDYEKDEPEVTTTDPDRWLDWIEESMSRPRGVPLAQFYEHPELYAAYPQLANLRVVAVNRQIGDSYGAFAEGRTMAQSTLLVASPYTLSSENPTVAQIIAHEIQHAIQRIEGFAQGASEGTFIARGSVSDELKEMMKLYVEIGKQAQQVPCPPETLARLSGYDSTVVQRIADWRSQGHWESNLASFRRDLMSPYELYFHEAGEVEARNVTTRMAMGAEERASTFPLNTIDATHPDLVRVTQRISQWENMASPERELARADSAFEWARKTQSWRTDLYDSAQLLHTGNDYNLFLVQSAAGVADGRGEVYAVALDDTVVGSFLYGPAGGAGQLHAAAMVSSAHRRQGIATSAYNAIEAFTGATLVPSPQSTENAAASAFWTDRSATPSAALETQDSSLAQWLRDSSAINDDGSPIVFYHGTMSAFTTFDASRHRSVLNQNYQGDGFHFTRDPEVASKYATAARNQTFRQKDLFEAADKVFPPLAAELLRGMVEEGHRVWDRFGGENFREVHDTCLAHGIDVNDLYDLSAHVEGSGTAQQTDNFLFATHHDQDMPEHIIDLAVELGLASAVPTPIVMPVYLRCENTLYTNDRAQARQAEANGYDSVCYSGPDIVDQQPEWTVFEQSQIRSVFEFKQDAKAIMQDNALPAARVADAPLFPPASTHFDRWFEGSNCINQFGPRIVFSKATADRPFSLFSDVGSANQDAQGKVTPAILAIRSPFIVTDKAVINAADLTAKLGMRKTGLIVAELMRDGQLQIDDIMASPRCAAWLQQAGYDGAMYRNPEGENRYVVFNSEQALLGSRITTSLVGVVEWAKVPALPTMRFEADQQRARQFTLSGQGKPHGHVVPLSAAHQYLTATDRLYVNYFNGERLTAVSIEKMADDHAVSKHQREFMTINRKVLVGQARIEEVFADHIRTLHSHIQDIRQEARQDTPQANHSRTLINKHMDALAWAVEHSPSGKSTMGIVNEDLLQWNRPLSEQGPLVRKALATLGIDGLYQVEGNGTLQLKTCSRHTANQAARDYPDGKVVSLSDTQATGRACYEELVNDLGSSKQAAQLLASMGVIGAQQSSNEVLLFKPEFNHQPLPPLMRHQPSKVPLDGGALAIKDLGGVLINQDGQAACHNIVVNQERAREKIDAAIHLVESRQAQLEGFNSPIAAMEERTRSQLAEARQLRKETYFYMGTHRLLPWSEPVPEEQLIALAPVIKLDQEHALPGSAVFTLLAGRQGGIEAAKDMLEKVGIIGVHGRESTMLWGRGVEALMQVVADDVPRSAKEMKQDKGHQRCLTSPSLYELTN